MARTGLGISCPACGKDLSIEGGLAPGVSRETIRLRAAEAEVTIKCDDCGSTVALGPSGTSIPPEPVPRPPFRRIAPPADEPRADLQRQADLR